MASACQGFVLGAGFYGDRREFGTNAVDNKKDSLHSFQKTMLDGWRLADGKMTATPSVKQHRKA
jgi:hypothetical protein